MITQCVGAKFSYYHYKGNYLQNSFWSFSYVLSPPAHLQIHYEATVVKPVRGKNALRITVHTPGFLALLQTEIVSPCYMLSEKVLNTCDPSGT